MSSRPSLRCLMGVGRGSTLCAWPRGPSPRSVRKHVTGWPSASIVGAGAPRSAAGRPLHAAHAELAAPGRSVACGYKRMTLSARAKPSAACGASVASPWCSGRRLPRRSARCRCRWTARAIMRRPLCPLSGRPFSSRRLGELTCLVGVDWPGAALVRLGAPAPFPRPPVVVTARAQGLRRRCRRPLRSAWGCALGLRT